MSSSEQKSSDRIYISVALEHQVEANAKYAPISIGAAREALGDVEAIGFDSDAKMHYVRESYLDRTGQSVKAVRDLMAPFMGRKAADLNAERLAEFPPKAAAADAVQIPVERRVPIYVPQYQVTQLEGGSYELVRGQQGGVLKGADWAKTEVGKFGASLMFVPHQWDARNKIEGLFVVDSAEVAKSPDFANWVKAQQTPAAIAATAYAQGLSKEDVRRLPPARDLSDDPEVVRFSIARAVQLNKVGQMATNAAFQRPNADGIFRLVKAVEAQRSLFEQDKAGRMPVLERAIAEATEAAKKRGDGVTRVDGGYTPRFSVEEKAKIVATAMSLRLDPARNGLTAADVAIGKAEIEKAGPKSDLGKLAAKAQTAQGRVPPTYDRLIAACDQTLGVVREVYTQKFTDKPFEQMYEELDKAYSASRSGQRRAAPVAEAAETSKGRVGRAMFAAS